MGHLCPHHSPLVSDGRRRRRARKRGWSRWVGEGLPRSPRVSTVTLITRRSLVQIQPRHQSPSQSVARPGLSSVRPLSGIYSPTPRRNPAVQGVRAGSGIGISDDHSDAFTDRSGRRRRRQGGWLPVRHSGRDSPGCRLFVWRPVSLTLLCSGGPLRQRPAVCAREPRCLSGPSCPLKIVP